MTSGAYGARGARGPRSRYDVILIVTSFAIKIPISYTCIRHARSEQVCIDLRRQWHVYVCLSAQRAGTCLMSRPRATYSMSTPTVLSGLQTQRGSLLRTAAVVSG